MEQGYNRRVWIEPCIGQCGHQCLILWQQFSGPNRYLPQQGFPVSCWEYFMECCEGLPSCVPAGRPALVRAPHVQNVMAGALLLFMFKRSLQDLPAALWGHIRVTRVTSVQPWAPQLCWKTTRTRKTLLPKGSWEGDGSSLSSLSLRK